MSRRPPRIATPTTRWPRPGRSTGAARRSRRPGAPASGPRSPSTSSEPPARPRPRCSASCWPCEIGAPPRARRDARAAERVRAREFPDRGEAVAAVFAELETRPCRVAPGLARPPGRRSRRRHRPDPTVSTPARDRPDHAGRSAITS